MNVNLYEYQRETIDKLKSGSILCGGVGSGKSRTALTYFFLKEGKGNISINGVGEYAPMKTPKDLYIITTARKRDLLEWDKEASYFLLSTHDELNKGTRFVVDSWNNIKKYVGVKDSFFIFDEQRLIGSGVWVKSFLEITKKNNWILLTATPGDNWLDYIPVFIANGFYKNRTEFIRRHVVFKSYFKFPKIDRYVETALLNRLKREITVNMAYTKKTQSFYKTINVAFDKEKFNLVTKKRWNIFKDKPIKNVTELFFLMRKVVNSDQSRTDTIKELLTKHKRIVIFYNFNYELDILRRLAEEIKIPVSEWNGSKHETIPNTKEWLYLVQYTAGAEGWNCTETNCIVFYSQNYSYKIMVQAAGRIDRLNTAYSELYYYHLVSESFIDLEIKKALKKKKNFSEVETASNLEQSV